MKTTAQIIKFVAWRRTKVESIASRKKTGKFNNILNNERQQKKIGWMQR